MRNAILVLLTIPVLVLVALVASPVVSSTVQFTSDGSGGPVQPFVLPYSIAVAIGIHVVVGMVFRRNSDLTPRILIPEQSQPIGSQFLMVVADFIARFLLTPLTCLFVIATILLDIVLFRNAGEPIPNLLDGDPESGVGPLRTTVLIVGGILLSTRVVIELLKKR